MKKPDNKVVIVLGLLFCTTIYAKNKKLKVDKEPAWVTINSVDYNNTNLDQQAEDGYIDVVFEKQVNLEQQAIFIKKTIKIISEAGVQNGSEISIGFDPSYERLTFHAIRIMRNKEWINKLEPSKIKIIQQETELERHIYDQSLSAILVLEDVRKGDIIEYSYTINGFNPIFNDKYSDVYATAFSVPINNLYYKIIVPTSRQLTIKNIGISIEPSIQKIDDRNIYEWSLKNISALRIQDKLPSWYDPYSAIFLSEFKSWQEVNNWALNLFPSFSELSPAFQQKVNEIRSKDPKPEKWVLDALQFVQDDIRYMGFEMGESSHKPFPPEKVLAQRFGDCKDKSYLLCTILQALNIEASPVLINSGYKKTIKTWLPSAKAFDHAIVQVKLNNDTYYFDPTISYQRGGLSDISFPDYQCGLVVNKGTTDLSDIPMHEKGMAKVNEIFDIPDMNGNARLKVITNYSGSFSDDIRSSFKNNSNYEMLKSFRDFYAPYFEKIKGDSLHFKDDEVNGIFTTEEFYSISGFWKIVDGKKKVQFQPFVINSIFKTPKEHDRSMPFSISFPASYEETIEIHVPEEWRASSSGDEISCDNFSMRSNFSYFNKKFLLKYEYKSFKDNVSVAEASHFFESYDKIDKSLAYSLTWGQNNETDQRIDYSKIPKTRIYIALSIGLFVMAVIAVIVWRILIK